MVPIVLAALHDRPDDVALTTFYVTGTDPRLFHIAATLVAQEHSIDRLVVRWWAFGVGG
jgi:hypothetical protein